MTLTTIHSAKGLEWEEVIVIDLVEGIIPERETIKAEQNGQKELIEEERRLFYVGMTRAKRHLTLVSVDYYHQKRVKVSRNVPLKNYKTLIMVTYILAQVLIVAGFLY